MNIRPMAYEASLSDMLAILLFHTPNIVEILLNAPFQVTKPRQLIIDL